MDQTHVECDIFLMHQTRYVTISRYREKSWVGNGTIVQLIKLVFPLSRFCSSQLCLRSLPLRPRSLYETRLLLSGSAPRNALGAVSPSTQLVQTWNKHKAPSFSGHSSPLQPCKSAEYSAKKVFIVNYESSSFNHSHRIVSEQTAHESFTASAIYGRFDGSG